MVLPVFSAHSLRSFHVCWTFSLWLASAFGAGGSWFNGMPALMHSTSQLGWVLRTFAFCPHRISALISFCVLWKYEKARIAPSLRGIVSDGNVGGETATRPVSQYFQGPECVCEVAIAIFLAKALILRDIVSEIIN